MRAFLGIFSVLPERFACKYIFLELTSKFFLLVIIQKLNNN